MALIRCLATHFAKFERCVKKRHATGCASMLHDLSQAELVGGER
jgi:hypothetical protein